MDFYQQKRNSPHKNQIYLANNQQKNIQRSKTYLADMNQRLTLQKNPSYIDLQSLQGYDKKIEFLKKLSNENYAFSEDELILTQFKNNNRNEIIDKDNYQAILMEGYFKKNGTDNLSHNYKQTVENMINKRWQPLQEEEQIKVKKHVIAHKLKQKFKCQIA
ncbi:hypothetical protein PPERSA_02198 [Pseudocohnilembus persalinus]|uniref:Uncharacterized protein n=1 Tax=Pseudocohnilembus persalinus TaxID=266149 RepID=A0A0V0R0K5_PSEPJ|nr:hypothetical protein PPERSA_02198 [Pseudocohnilembus persalinus]|eukprot:KRX08066.1 hypothetical protein PPERSA_02198 [Pseudocohnilembus persalinus]